MKESDDLQTPIHILNLTCVLSNISTTHVKPYFKLLVIIR